MALLAQIAKSKEEDNGFAIVELCRISFFLFSQFHDTSLYIAFPEYVWVYNNALIEYLIFP